MKALSCDGPNALRLIERDVPKRGADEVLLRMRRAGICGTDYHIVHGNQPFFEYPRVIGHELAAEVVEVPAGSPFRPGQIVAIEPYVHCGQCRACRRGRTNCCQSLQVLGVHKDGGLTEYLSLPPHLLVAADGLEPDHAAMVEFLAIGAHGIRRAGTKAGDRVLVVGAGPIGIAAAIFAKARSAEVTVTDMSERRLAFCQDQLKVAATHQAGPDLRDRLGKATGGEFYDLVIDATGSVAAMNAGFLLVGHGGSYLLLSIVRDAVSFPDPEFHKRETTLFASRNATREDFVTVLDTMRTGLVPLAALASHHGPLREAPSLIPLWSKPETGVIKGIVTIAD